MAELKERHGLGRCSLRSRSKVLVQAYLAAIAYDIKKLVRAPRPQPQPIAVALRSTRGTPPVPCALADAFAQRPQWLTRWLSARRTCPTI